MKKILFISTGGTFNKHYNEETGAISIDTEANTLKELAQKWRTEFEVKNIIGKDSLDMNESDRKLLLKTIKSSTSDSIIVIHGTDTMDLSTKIIDDAKLDKKVIFTGAMVPYRVDKVEATANVSMAYGFLRAVPDSGVYIAMNGVVGKCTNIMKNRKTMRFESV